MATETWAGPLGELRAASEAGGGTALTTTATYIQIPNGTHHIQIIPRNFSTAVVAKVAKNPYLFVLKTTDLLAAKANTTDYSDEAQDADISTVVTLSSLSTLANNDALYVGSRLPFRGVSVDVTAANATASVITVTYWDGSAWTDTSATDGTASGGASLAVDGTVSWTVPTDWAQEKLVTSASAADSIPYAGMPLYWTRWVWSGGLDASTTLASMLAMNRSTAYAEYPSGIVYEEGFTKGPGAWGCVEALTDAGTGNLIVNCATRVGDRGFS